MKLLDMFRRAQVGTKESSVGSAMVLTPGQPVWSDWDNAKAAREAYQQNVVAAMAISKIAEGVASVDWEVWRGEKQLTDHPLLELLERPNPMQSGREYMEAYVSFLMIAGNAYEEAITVQGEPRELYNLRPDRMSILPGTNGFPVGYEYTGANGKKIRWSIDVGRSDFPVWHTRLFNPLNNWLGQSPTRAGGFSIDQHNEAMKWMQALLQNSARPSGALVSKDGAHVSEEQFNRLKAELEASYQGAGNAGRPMLLEGGLDWKAMGLSPTDMGIIEAKNSAARDVALSFGVPPQLLGIPGDNTYANYKEARLAFWEDTVLPLLGRVTDERNAWLAGPQGVMLKPNLDKVPAIVDKRETLWSMADKSQDLTINERRELKGYEPISGGDQLPQQKTPVTDNEADVKALAKLAGYDYINRK